MDLVKPKETEYELYKKYLMCGERTCENSFLNAVFWRSYDYRYSQVCGSLIIRLSEGNNHRYFLPIGGDFVAAVKEIIAAENGKPVFCISEGQRMQLFLKNFGDAFRLFPIEDNFEYIYNRELLADLPGKKYHQKRNHISAFSRNYNWHFEAMSENNIPDVITVADKWFEEHNGRDVPSLCEEHDSIKRVLSFFTQLNIIGVIVYVDNEPVAFSFGTAVSDDTFDVNIEKALSDYPGAYAVVNNVLAKSLNGFLYLNREDDLGIAGLRKSKLSYYPEIILKKYIATAVDN